MGDREKSRYCKQCDYPLCEGTARECPECGAPFDPADAETYNRQPRDPMAKIRAFMDRYWRALFLLSLALGAMFRYLMSDVWPRANLLLFVAASLMLIVTLIYPLWKGRRKSDGEVQ